MAGPSFRFVCLAGALEGAPGDWAREMLREGEVALLPGDGGLAAVNEIAGALELPAVLVVRGEPAADAQEETVIAYAGELPLVWAAAEFSDRARAWARERGPMTLLVEATGPLSPGERARIARFVAVLGRQSE